MKTRRVVNRGSSSSASFSFDAMKRMFIRPNETKSGSGELAKTADAIGFPDHEIVQRLPRLVRDESYNDRVIDEAQKANANRRNRRHAILLR
jgi:hypothetical protein